MLNAKRNLHTERHQNCHPILETLEFGEILQYLNCFEGYVK